MVDHSSSERRRQVAKSRGYTLIEMAAALVVVSAAMISLVEFVSLATRQRRISRQRLIAITEVANQAERLAQLGWNDTAPDKLTTWQPSPLLAAEIASAECRIVVHDEEGPPTARRLELSVSWPNAAGQTIQPVALTIWKYRQEGNQ